MNRRKSWVLGLAAIIAAGMGSRVIHTGFPLFDKYLGDALYAAMAYAILRVVRPFAPAYRVSAAAMAAMTALELFQLTLIPARLFTNANVVVRIAARLMGTEFHLADLVAYAVGIACILLIDRRTAGMPR